MQSRRAPMVTPYDGDMATSEEFTGIPEQNAAQAPIISVATRRPIQHVSLGDHIYQVKRPKTVIDAEPKSRILLVAEAIYKSQKHSNQITDHITAAQFTEGVTAVWRYLQLALAPDDGEAYRSIRRRVYGNVPDDLAESVEYLTLDQIEDQKSIGEDDLDIEDVTELVIKLIDLWMVGSQDKKSGHRPPPMPAKKKPATVRKKTASRR